MKILQVAANILSKAPKIMNKSNAIKFGAGVAVGLAAGALLTNCMGKNNNPVGDSFETEQKSDTTESLLNYPCPEIGKDGIVSTDTIYFDDATMINYYLDDKKEDLKYRDIFDMNGKLKSYGIMEKNEDESKIFTLYNSEGKVESTDKILVDNDEYREHIFTYYGNEGYSSSTFEKEYIKDGITIKDESGSYEPHTITKYDKEYKVVEKNVLDDNDVLEYTVKPKYNKDGIVVKNDTVWNKKKV